LAGLKIPVDKKMAIATIDPIAIAADRPFFLKSDLFVNDESFC